MGNTCSNYGKDAVDPQLFCRHKYQKGCQNLNQHVKGNVLHTESAQPFYHSIFHQCEQKTQYHPAM
ncbi:hypothetical protein D3C80_1697940 [compost metagenome]